MPAPPTASDSTGDVSGAWHQRLVSPFGVSPYYEDAACAIYHCDVRKILPHLGWFDAMITDPPYPGYEKGWEVPEVSWILGNIRAAAKLVFWPAKIAPPLPEPDSEHIWEKPNGNSSIHYEKIYCYGDTKKTCRVFRVAAILPNYTQYKHESVDHPCQKPLKMVGKLIQMQKPMTIIDPFLGSGTTLEAAKIAGIKAIGIEKEERYCEMAAKRLHQEMLNFEG